MFLQQLVILEENLVTITGSTLDHDEIEDMFDRYGRIRYIFKNNNIGTGGSIQVGGSYDFRHLYPSGLFSDLKIVLPGSGDVFLVHKAILSSISPYFKTLINRKDNTIKMVVDFDSKIFSFVLDYIYGYPVSTESLDFLRFLLLAEEFLIEGIDADKLMSKLSIEDVDMSNVDQYLELVDYLYPNGLSEDIISIVIRYIPDNMDIQDFEPEMQDAIIKRRQLKKSIH